MKSYMTICVNYSYIMLMLDYSSMCRQLISWSSFFVCVLFLFRCMVFGVIILCLHTTGCKGKYYQLLYLMNKLDIFSVQIT